MQEGSDPIKDMILESGLDTEEYAGVAEVLAALRSVVPSEAPAPSPELAALIAGGVVTALRPRKSAVSIASGLAAALVLGGGVAAASNHLPEPLQRFAHNLSEKVLPFEFPSPEDRLAQGREGPVQLPEQARNDTDQGKHVGGGDGGGKTGNVGQDEGKKPAEPGKPTDLPTEPPEPPVDTPTPPPPPDKPDQAGGDDQGGNAGDQSGDQGGAPTDETTPSQGGSKPTDPGKGSGGNGGDKGGDSSAKSGDRSSGKG